jgi:lysine-N-methylase
MAATVQQTQAVAAFRCTGDQCPDTCCKGWGMQLSAETVALYQTEAPELLDAVTSGEAEHIMRRDPQTDYCVKFDAGWCGIHKQYGDRMLGDACHFFPRITRRLGDITTQTATLSCPEIARLSLFADAPATPQHTTLERLPHSLTDYLPEGLAAADAWGLHQSALAATRDETASAERILMRLSAAARALETQPVAQWPGAFAFFLKIADTRLPPPQAKAEDPFNLINALQGLIGAAKKTARPRLMETLDCMTRALGVTLQWNDLTIQTAPDSLTRFLAIDTAWRTHYAAHYAPILKRWLEAQLSASLFPFCGLGNSLSERIAILAVRFATLKLALMCACHETGGALPEAETIRITQSLARFLDHLADPALSLAIYTETGWTLEARMRALVGDG